MEEELLLVSPDDGRAIALADSVLRMTDEPRLDPELMRQQLELDTKPCTTIDELATELRLWRRKAAEAAEAAGANVAAIATSPMPVDTDVTWKQRYLHIAERFGLTAQEQLVCGCHVHVEIASPEEGVAALDRLRPWLPVLLALSANSPYFNGVDTSYATYRSQVVERWPSSGTPSHFGSYEEYRRVLDAMLDTDVLRDEGMVWFDARLSRTYPTLEVRVADVCLRWEDTVLLATLTRALVETEIAAWQREEPFVPPRPELLRLAKWTAARNGIEGQLLDPDTGKPSPAALVIGALVDRVTPVLAEWGELDVTQARLADVMGRGTGARVQRELRKRTDDPAALIREVVRQTVLGVASR